MKSEVYLKNPPRFNLCGQSLPTGLSLKSDESISTGLCKRLYRYGLKDLEASGFDGAVEGWEVCVYTIDAEECPSDRSYCVRWTNEEGGYIEVIGILTNKGWPFISHGLDIGR